MNYVLMGLLTILSLNAMEPEHPGRYRIAYEARQSYENALRVALADRDRKTNLAAQEKLSGTLDKILEARTLFSPWELWRRETFQEESSRRLLSDSSVINYFFVCRDSCGRRGDHSELPCLEVVKTKLGYGRYVEASRLPCTLQCCVEALDPDAAQQCIARIREIRSQFSWAEYLNLTLPGGFWWGEEMQRTYFFDYDGCQTIDLLDSLSKGAQKIEDEAKIGFTILRLQEVYNVKAAAVAYSSRTNSDPFVLLRAPALLKALISLKTPLHTRNLLELACKDFRYDRAREILQRKR